MCEAWAQYNDQLYTVLITARFSMLTSSQFCEGSRAGLTLKTVVSTALPDLDLLDTVSALHQPRRVKHPR